MTKPKIAGKNTVFSFQGIYLEKCLTIAPNGAIMLKRLEADGLLTIKDGFGHPYELVLIVMWVHLFPSRTQKLSTCTPTILGGRLPGKIGNANTNP